MSTSDTVSYQERVVVTIDERKWAASLAAAERQYKTFITNVQKTKLTPIPLTVKDDASKVLTKLQQQAKTLTSQKHSVTVAAQDNATATLNRIRTTAATLGRTKTTVNVNVHDTATQQLRAISNQASRLARGAVSLPLGIASQAAQSAGASLGPAGAAVGAVALGGGMAAGVVGVGAALGVATKSAADFNAKIVETQNNTTMLPEDIKVLRSSVLALSQEFGLSTDGLTDEARQIQDLTQNTVAMQGIMSVAAETAAATGSDVSQTGNILASTLHQYKQDQGDASTVTLAAAHAMGVLHLASAEGNMTMQQFADSTGRSIALGAQLGVPLEQIAAAQAALTRNGYDASLAQTQVVNIMTRIANPTAAAEKQIEALSKTSGVDLVSAFTATGISTLGLTGIFHRTVDAYEKLGMSNAEATSETFKLLQAQRGGIGAALLMGKGADDYDQILKDLTNTQKTDTYVQQAWARSLEQPNTQLNILHQRVNAAFIELGQNFTPVLTWGITQVENLGGGIVDLAGKLGGIVAPLMGAATPMDALNQIANSAGYGLKQMSDWLVAFTGEIVSNGALSTLGDTFGIVSSNLGPVVDLLNPFRQGISDSTDPTQKLADSSHDAASAFKDMATFLHDVATEIAPVVSFMQNLERTINNISHASGAAGADLGQQIRSALHMPQNTAATSAANTAAFQGLPGQAAGFVTQGAKDVTGAIGGMLDSAQGALGLGWNNQSHQNQIDAARAAMGGDNLLSPADTQAAMNKLQQQAITVGSGFTKGLQDAQPDAEAAAKANAQAAIDSTRDTLDSHSPSRVFNAIGGDIVQGLIDGISGKTAGLTPAILAMVATIKTSFDSSMSSASGIKYGSGGATGGVTDWLTSAIQQVKQAGGSADESWLPGLQKLVGMESSGNPLAMNPTAVNGEHATGLLQTLPSTFQANMMSGHNDINDPVDNAIAAIQYIQKTYGSVYNTPAFKPGSYQGYANGGWINEPVFGIGTVSRNMYGFAENKPEFVGANPSLLGTRAPAEQAGSFAPQITVIQQPGEDGEALAARISEQIAGLMPVYLHSFALHIGNSLSNMPEESFG